MSKKLEQYSFKDVRIGKCKLNCIRHVVKQSVKRELKAKYASQPDLLKTLLLVLDVLQKRMLEDAFQNVR